MTDVTEAQVLGQQSAWAAAQTAGSVKASETNGVVTVTNASGSPVSVPVTVPPGTTVGGAAFGQPYGGELSTWTSVPAAGTTTLTEHIAPTITSASSATSIVGAPFSATVTTTGLPAPAITETGALPKGLTFTDNGNGTATLAGAFASGPGGSYPITITATSTSGTATQVFTLTLATLPPPAVSAAAVSSTDVVVVGRNPWSELWYQQSSGGGSSWTGWQSVATSDVASQPAAVVSGSNLYVFFRATDNELHYFERVGTTWGTEQNLGGIIVGNPTAAVDGNGQVIVVALNSAGNVWTEGLPSGGSWTGWTSLAGILSGDVSLSTLSGNVYLLGIDPAGSGWTQEWTTGSTNAWGGWTPLGGIFEAGTTLSGAAYNGVLHVQGINSEGVLYETTGSGSNWSGWTPLNGILAATPSLAATSSSLFVFDTNPAGSLWDQQNTISWQGWNPLGGVLESGPITAAAGANAFVFGLNPDGNLWYRQWSGSTFGAWTNLGGILATA
jgi:hypothetical protein